jgi:predicted DNA-binding transcriptional regulator AlpA
MIEDKILNELQAIKKLTLLAAKQALTMNDAVLLTGLSKSHLYKLTSGKKIPFYKSCEGGKNNYFDKGELTAWLLQHRYNTTEETESDAAMYVVRGKK